MSRYYVAVAMEEEERREQRQGEQSPARLQVQEESLKTTWILLR